MTHADGTIETFADRRIDVHLARVPAAFSTAAEQVADELIELLVPLRFRDLYRRDRLRAVGTTRPLLPTTLVRAVATGDVVATLNSALATESDEVVEWT